MMAAPVLPILLGLTAVAAIANTAIFANTNQAFAWGPDFPRYNIGGDLGGRYGENIGIGEPAGPGSYDNGYYAGTLFLKETVVVVTKDTWDALQQKQQQEGDDNK